jgi:uncharacterized membrane protein YgaE (UPF0421/DUF939 family)
MDEIEKYSWLNRHVLLPRSWPFWHCEFSLVRIFVQVTVFILLTERLHSVYATVPSTILFDHILSEQASPPSLIYVLS